MSAFDGVPQLGGTQQVIVTERRILAPAMVTMRTNGLTVQGCQAHIEVLDIVTGRMYLIPVSDRQLNDMKGFVNEL